MTPPVVDVDWLDQHPEAVLADVRWYPDGRSPLEAFAEGHLPGAIFISVDDVLAGPPSDEAGRHPLPGPAAFAASLGALGIGDDDVVVAYDDAGGVIAARLVWMLRAIGHEAALLDGGITAWAGATSTATTRRSPALFTPRPWPSERLADIDEVASAGQSLVVPASAPGDVLLDARPAERYAGAPDALDPRAGHVPGAVSLPAREHVDADGRLLPVEDLRERFTASGVTGENKVISSCGSGITACHTLLVMEHAGLGAGRLFPGSWSQWSRDPSRPSATGAPAPLQPDDSGDQRAAMTVGGAVPRAVAAAGTGAGTGPAAAPALGTVQEPSTGAYDVDAVRAHFPALEAGVAHFDSPGGTQVPREVADAIAASLTAPTANRGGLTAAARASEAIVAGFRASVADLLNADPRGVVLGRSATQLTFDLARTLSAGWGPGDEVVVSRLDHDANVRPWVIAAQRAGARVRWLDFDPETGELTPDHLRAVLGERTRLVAVTGASNLIGTRPDVTALAALAHDSGALTWVDGVHLTAHAPVDVATLGADFYVCSAYKFLGPHCSALAASPDLLETLRPDKLAPSTDAVPERFELGTLPYELMAGATAAVDFLASLAPDASHADAADTTADTAAGAGRRARLVTAMTAVEAHEDRLRERLEEGLAALPGVVLRSRAAHRTPTLLLTYPSAAPGTAAAASEHLAALGVNAPASSFYALEASRHLGLGDAGGLRVGLAPYSDDRDVDRLLDGLRGFTAG